eukprot:2357972-Rhodomonas_salina.1
MPLPRSSFLFPLTAFLCPPPLPLSRSLSPTSLSPHLFPLGPALSPCSTDPAARARAHQNVGRRYWTPEEHK